jgi:hypothetical protein
MSKYASLLFTPESYHVIGPFRFPIYHDLVPGEAKGIEQISKKQSRYTFNSIKLAQKIAKDKGITTKEAVDMLGNGNEQNQDIFYEYAAELEELQQLSISPTEQKIAITTLFMKYRAEVKLPRSRDWQKVQDWSEEDTENVPTKLLNQITEFVAWERDGWPEAGKEEEPQTWSKPPNNS